MTAVAEPAKLTHRIAESAGAISPTQIERIAKETWQVMRDLSDTKLQHDGRSGYHYTGAMTRASARAGGAVRTGMSADQRDVLDNAVRQFLKHSGNASCINQQRGHVEWWVSASWSAAAAIHSTIPGKGGERQPNWYETKVTPEQAGETRPPAPVTVRKIDGWEPPTQDEPKVEAEPVEASLDIHPKWRKEILSWLSRSKHDSTNWLVVTMCSTWDEPFSTDSYAQLHNTTPMAPSAALLTLQDAGLVNVTEPNGTHRRRQWWTTSAQRAALVEIMKAAPNHTSPVIGNFHGQEIVLGALLSRNYLTTTQLAQKLFMSRSRLINLLAALFDQSLIEKHRGGVGSGRSAAWRRTAKAVSTPEENTEVPNDIATAKPGFDAKTASPPTAPAAAPVAAFSNAIPSPSAMPKKVAPPSSTEPTTVTIARMVESLVETQVAGVRRDLERRIEISTHDLDDVKAQLEQVKAERDELLDWKTKFQAFLNS